MAEAIRTKRIRRDPETARSQILDMTEQVMIEEGYAAVSSRCIAQRLGLNAATIHYYYPATDDLFNALHRRMTDRLTDGLAKALASDNPLVAFWELQSGWSKTALGVEFLALSNHRKAIRDTLAAATSEARRTSAEAIAQALGGISMAGMPVSPMIVSTVLVAIGRLLSNEERVGITAGHEEVHAFVNQLLSHLLASRRA